MTLPDILIKKKDFISSGWEKIISNARKKECHVYNSLFSNRIQECEKENNKNGVAIFALLGAVTSFTFKPESPTEPFEPLFIFANSRGLIPSDFTKNNLDSLKNFADITTDQELLARICDVLWLRKHDHSYARKAINAYLESANILEDPHSWPPSAERTERSLRLAVSINDLNIMKKITDHIETILKKYNGSDPLFFSSRLMELLVEFRKGDPSNYVPICRKMAEQGLLECNWHKARVYFEIEAKWQKLVGNKEGKIKALVDEAEVYVKEAENAATSEKPSCLVASTQLRKAVEAYRRIGGHQNRIDEIHKTLLGYQKRIPEEMHEISHSMDISELVKRSQDRVAGKEFIEALRIVALSTKSPNVKDLESRTKKIIKNHPISFLVSGVSVNREGKVICNAPNVNIGFDDIGNENAIRAEMYNQANMVDIPINTQGIIDPARRIILSEHRGNPSDFLQLVRSNPFVPPDREKLYSRALSSGLNGDLITFLGIAVPQVENSIRYLLFQNGIPTSKIDNEGIQREINLSELLFMKEVQKILGEDLTFDLQGLLVLPMGANLRNRFAHGLLDSDEFYSAHVLYFWWLILRIIVLCLITIEDKKAKNS